LSKIHQLPTKKAKLYFTVTPSPLPSNFFVASQLLWALQTTFRIAGRYRIKQKKIEKANSLSFVLKYIGHTCHFAVDAGLSNFCHGFTNP